jgi:hypothetical protein
VSGGSSCRQSGVDEVLVSLPISVSMWTIAYTTPVLGWLS